MFWLISVFYLTNSWMIILPLKNTYLLRYLVCPVKMCFALMFSMLILHAANLMSRNHLTISAVNLWICAGLLCLIHYIINLLTIGYTSCLIWLLVYPIWLCHIIRIACILLFEFCSSSFSFKIPIVIHLCILSIILFLPYFLLSWILVSTIGRISRKPYVVLSIILIVSHIQIYLPTLFLLTCRVIFFYIRITRLVVIFRRYSKLSGYTLQVLVPVGFILLSLTRFSYSHHPIKVCSLPQPPTHCSSFRYRNRASLQSHIRCRSCIVPSTHCLPVLHTIPAAWSATVALLHSVI